MNLFLSSKGVNIATVYLPIWMTMYICANIDVAYRGRLLKVPGDRSFEDWTVTVLSDPEWQARTSMESWMNAIQNHSQNRSSVSATNVYGNATVSQLNRDGGVLRTYRLQDIYPTTLSAIELSMDPDGAPEEFAVTFAVNNYFTSITSNFFNYN